MALQKVNCFLRLETSGNKAVEKQNLEQDPVKCLGDMSVSHKGALVCLLVRGGAPSAIKFGYLCIQEILVLTTLPIHTSTLSC